MSPVLVEMLCFESLWSVAFSDRRGRYSFGCETALAADTEVLGCKREVCSMLFLNKNVCNWFISSYKMAYFSHSPSSGATIADSSETHGFNSSFYKSRGFKKNDRCRMEVGGSDYQFNVTPLWLVLQKIYSWLQFPVLYLAAHSMCKVQYLPRACLHLQGYFIAGVIPTFSGGSQVEFCGWWSRVTQSPQAGAFIAKTRPF